MAAEWWLAAANRAPFVSTDGGSIAPPSIAAMDEKSTLARSGAAAQASRSAHPPCAFGPHTRASPAPDCPASTPSATVRTNAVYDVPSTIASPSESVWVAEKD